VHKSLESTLAAFLLAALLFFLAFLMYSMVLDLAHKWFDWNKWRDRIGATLVAFVVLVAAFGSVWILAGFIPFESPPPSEARFAFVAFISGLLIITVLSDAWANFKCIRRAFRDVVYGNPGSETRLALTS